jgi:hypothetical protein
VADEHERARRSRAQLLAKLVRVEVANLTNIGVAGVRALHGMGLVVEPW